MFIRLSHGNNAYRFIRFRRGDYHHNAMQQLQREKARFAIVKAPILEGDGVGAFEHAPRIVKIQPVLFSGSLLSFPGRGCIAWHARYTHLNKDMQQARPVNFAPGLRGG